MNRYAVGEVMWHLIADPNLRIRLIAASSLLAADPSNARALAALGEALEDQTLRVRTAALAFVESLGSDGAALLEGQKHHPALPDGPALQDARD